jgi:hypothetical protein
MRVTVHFPDSMENDIREAARELGTSVSALTAAAVSRYICDERRKRCGEQVLGLAGTVSIPPGILMELERERAMDDRA